MYILFQFFFARLTDELLVFIIIVLPVYRTAQWSFHLANPPSGTQTVPIKGDGHIIFVFMCIAAIYPFFICALGTYNWRLQTQRKDLFSHDHPTEFKSFLGQLSGASEVWRMTQVGAWI